MNGKFLESLKYVISEASGHLSSWNAWGEGGTHVDRIEKFARNLESIEQDDLEDWAEGIWAGVEYRGNKSGAENIKSRLTDLFGGE